jgi:uracil phosphoribosyltransferase
LGNRLNSCFIVPKIPAGICPVQFLYNPPASFNKIIVFHQICFMNKTTLGQGGDLVESNRQSDRLAEGASMMPDRHLLHSPLNDIVQETGRIGALANSQLEDTRDLARELSLNAGCTREEILRAGLCEEIRLSEDLLQAFENLRRGYPDQPLEKQCQGREFREQADLIIDAIAGQTLRGLDPAKVVVMMPWRAGLAFSRSYLERGVEKFYHVSSRRDEKTLQTIVDYESGLVEPDDTVIMADPMLATGNTAVDAINRMLAGGITPGQIIVNAVVAAPVGIKAVKKFPEIRVVAGILDDKLDHRGYIVPGLGDFGDKYFGNYTREQVDGIAAALKLELLPHQKLTARFGLPVEQ